MSDTQHRTDTICTYKVVQAGKQIRHWLEARGAFASSAFSGDQ